MFRPRRYLIHFLVLTVSAAAQGQQSTDAYRQTVLAIQQQIEANHLDKARSMVRVASRQYPSDGGLENLLGIIDVQQGRADEARSEFSRATQHSPRLESAWLNLGRICFETAEKDASARQEALRAYSRLLQLDPSNVEGNYDTAVLLSWDHSYQASMQHVMRLDAESRRKLQVQELICADALALGSKETAERAVTAMAANPELKEADATAVLPGLRKAHRADLVDALFTAVQTRTPLSAGALRVLGLAQEAEGNYSDARATLERVFAMDPNSAVPLVDLTRIALAMKDYQGALGYLAHARQLNPKDASLPYEFGLVCLKLNLVGEAARAMGEAVQLAPDNPKYNFGMGTVSSFAQDPSKAIPYLIRYHELRPQDAEGVLTLGSTYFRNRDFDNAEIWLRKAAGNPSTAASAHYYLGRIDRERGKYEQAIAEFNQSLRLNPDRADALAELGQVYLQQRKLPEAQKQIDHAMQLDAASYAANFALLQYYVLSHDPRREEQAKRFQALKGKDEEAYRETMRIIEVRPQGDSPDQP